MGYRSQEHLFAQPGLEVAPARDDKYFVSNGDQSDKQLIAAEDEKEVSQSARSLQAPLMSLDPSEPELQKPARSRRICGLKRAVFWAILVAALLAIALAVGLGVGLTSSKSDTASSASPITSNATSTSSTASSATPTAASEKLHIGGSMNPSYYTNTGAWNGSGISYVWQNFTQDWDDILRTNEYSHVVYFQHHSGEIHWMRQTSDYSWKEGPEDLLVVAADARNSTPISAVQYTANGTNYWNVFCEFALCWDGADDDGVLWDCVLMTNSDIDTDNFIRQRSGNNRTTGWTEGSIAKSKIAAWDGDLVGLTACSSALDESAPIRLFYASSSTSVEEYLWRAEKDEWVQQQTWEGYSGAAGVGCFGGTGAYRYLGLVNTDNQLEIWYQASEDVGTDWQKGQWPHISSSQNPSSRTDTATQHNKESPTSTQHLHSPSPSTMPSTKTQRRTKSESRPWTGRTSTPATTAPVFRPLRGWPGWQGPG
jgi:hypothetical protein